jgi:hypothetical protein
VAQEVDVELELGAGGREGEHRVVELLERGLLAQEVQAAGDAADMGVDGDVAATRSRGSPMASRMAWMRRDLTLEIPPGRMACSTSSLGASRTASQVGKRSRSPRKATSRLRSLVDWLRTVSTSSPRPSPWGGATGRP